MPDLSRPVGAIDLGGTSVRAAVVDVNGGIAGFVAGATEASQGPDAVIDRIVALLHESLARASVHEPRTSQLSGLARPGRSTGPPASFTRRPICRVGSEVRAGRSRIGDAVGLPAFLENDANAAALAEWQYGVGQRRR